MNSYSYPPLSSEVRFLLPIHYLAWADDVLTPTEAEQIRTIIGRQTWISEEDQIWLAPHLDPASPPEAMEIKSWLQMIRRQSSQLSSEEKYQLLSLSRNLSSLGEGPDSQELAALKQIEKALTGSLQTEEALKEALSPKADPSPEAPTESASFSPSTLRKLLEGPQLEVKENVFRLLSDPAFSYQRIPEKSSDYRELVLEWLQHLADRGLGALSYPPEVNGAGNMREYIAVFEAMGHHDISLLVKFGVQFGLFGGAILNLGTREHHQRYLPDTGSLALPGCFAMTEANHGSNVRGLETTATYQPESDTFLIQTPHDQAFKEYIGNAAAHAKMAVVFAQLYTEEECFGVHAFLVPIRDESGKAMPGVTIGDSGHKLGLNGVDNGRLWFNQVSVPRENLLDRFGQIHRDGSYHSDIASESARFFTMLGTLVGGRICVPMGGLSAARSGLAIAIRYAHHRRQFGKPGEPEIPIMDYPSHQMRLMPLLADSIVLEVVQRILADRYCQELPEGEISRELESLAAGVKAVSTWHTTTTLQECREACGGNGFLSINRLGNLKSDTDIFTTFEGDNTVLLQLVARGRLTTFQKSFGKMGIGGMVNWAGQEAWRVMSEMNPLITRNTDSKHLLDAEFHQAAFRYQEERLVWTAGQRIRRRIAEGVSPADAFVEIQNHLLLMAKAYVRRVLLEEYQSWLSSITESAEKEILTKIGQLFALNALRKESGWFLEQDYFQGTKSKAITRLVEELAAEVSKESLGLVSSWAIPDTLLYAPIQQEPES